MRQPRPLFDDSPRARAFLEFIAAGSDDPATTGWGDYRAFDATFLAPLALGRLDAAGELLRQTLDMMDANIAEEDGDPHAKWHLADFALHGVLRGRQMQASALAPLWRRFEALLSRFIWHDGDLTENHNLLHLAGRYLVGQWMPDRATRDGRPAAAMVEPARRGILQWCRDWFCAGSAEWGSELYYNVNLLALLNLHDYAPDATVRAAAKGVIDGLMLDLALDCFAGALNGAARRHYACYRIDARVNPSRPVAHMLLEQDSPEPFNRHFIGGALMVACAGYRVPPALPRVARPPQRPLLWHADHAVALFGAEPGIDTIGKTTWRSRHAMLSTLYSGPGAGRFTEQVVQATLGEQAVVFANHPALRSAAWYSRLSPAELADVHRAARADARHPLWIAGNLPPGTPDEMRPGYWQGNVVGPRSLQIGRTAGLAWRLPDEFDADFVHVHFPRDQFDEVRDRGRWTLGRRGDGYIAFHASAPARWIDEGIWRGREARVPGPCVGLVFVAGDRDDGSFDEFASLLDRVAPQFDAEQALLRFRAMDGGARVELWPEAPPLVDGSPWRPPRMRFDTPFGSLPLGQDAFDLSVDGEVCRLGVPEGLDAP